MSEIWGLIFGRAFFVGGGGGGGLIIEILRYWSSSFFAILRAEPQARSINL